MDANFGVGKPLKLDQQKGANPWTFTGGLGNFFLPLVSEANPQG